MNKINKAEIAKLQIAGQFNYLTAGKYVSPADCVRTVGPSPHSYTKDKATLVQYEITFVDGSKSVVVLTDAQYYGLRRSQWWDKVKTTGGQGYRKLAA